MEHLPTNRLLGSRKKGQTCITSSQGGENTNRLIIWRIDGEERARTLSMFTGSLVKGFSWYETLHSSDYQICFHQCFFPHIDQVVISGSLCTKDTSLALELQNWWLSLKADFGRFWFWHVPAMYYWVSSIPVILLRRKYISCSVANSNFLTMSQIQRILPLCILLSEENYFRSRWISRKNVSAASLC